MKRRLSIIFGAGIATLAVVSIFYYQFVVSADFIVRKPSIATQLLLSADGQKIQALTVQLLQIPPSIPGQEPAGQLDELKKLATERADLLTKLISSNPNEAAGLFLPPVVAANLAGRVGNQDLVEHSVTVSGLLTALHGDNWDAKNILTEVPVVHITEAKTGQLFDVNWLASLSFAQFENLNRHIVVLQGTAINHQLLLTSGQQSLLNSSGAQLLGAQPLGGLPTAPRISDQPATTKRALIILMTAKDLPIPDKLQTQDWIDQLKNMIFGPDRSVNQFYQLASYGKVSLSGDITPWITLDQPDDNGQICSNLETLKQALP